MNNYTKVKCLSETNPVLFGCQETAGKEGKETKENKLRTEAHCALRKDKNKLI